MFLEMLEREGECVKEFAPFQEKAKVKVNESGFPSRKDENFKYISLSDLSKRNLVNCDESYKIEVNSDKVEVIAMSKALQKYGLAIVNKLSKMDSYQESFFSLMNKGLVKDPVCIFVHESIDDVVEVLESIKADNTFAAPRVYIFVNKGVKAEFHHTIEVEGKGNCISSHVDVSCEKDSNFTMNCAYFIEKDNDYFAHLVSLVKENASFTHRSGVKGCKTFRSEVKAYLLEKESNVNLEGFWNSNSHDSVHHHINCTHLAPNTNSRQHYQGVVDDFARASFEGQIYIDQVAQKTDSYQLSKHLVVGEKSRAFTKPNLEVFADDVIASHGACVSMISQEELLYLKSRGIDQKKGEKLLQKSFISFFMDKLEEKTFKNFSRLIDA